MIAAMDAADNEAYLGFDHILDMFTWNTEKLVIHIPVYDK